MFFVFWLPVLLLCFCRIPGQVSIMESKNHFNSAKIAIEQIAAHYDYVMGETIDHYTDNEAYKDLTVTNDNEEIRIRLMNDAGIRKFGSESYYVEYEVNGKDHPVNVALFADILKELAADSPDNEYIEEFLRADEGEYPAEDYGYKKYDDIIVYKYRQWSFWTENNELYYKLYKQGTQILITSGLFRQD